MWMRGGHASGKKTKDYQEWCGGRNREEMEGDLEVAVKKVRLTRRENKGNWGVKRGRKMK